MRNIGKITKAMKMVAASRLRSVQNRCEQSRGSIKPGLRALGDLPNAPSERTTVVTLASDRGLCGAINTNIVKHTKVLRDVTSASAHAHFLCFDLPIDAGIFRPTLLFFLLNHLYEHVFTCLSACICFHLPCPYCSGCGVLPCAAR